MNCCIKFVHLLYHQSKSVIYILINKILKMFPLLFKKINSPTVHLFFAFIPHLLYFVAINMLVIILI